MLKQEFKKDLAQSRVDFLLEWIPQSTKEAERIKDDLTSPFVKSDEGFLQGTAVVTNIGVFPYLMQDGSIRRELRLQEEVFSRESLDSLRMKPLTNDHPGEAVTSENVKDLSVGSIGSDIRVDSMRVAAPMTINQAEAVEDVQQGKRALSCGYRADIEMASGVWMGVQYDAIQRNIRYNHVALVERGRAGDEAVLTLDSGANTGFHADGVCVQHLDKFHKHQSTSEDSTVSLKKITLDGVEREAEAEVLVALNGSQTKVDTLEKQVEAKTGELSGLQAKHDTLEEQNTQLKSDLEEAKKAQPEAIAAAVKARSDLFLAAKNAGVEVKEDQSDEEIRKAVILKAFPKADEKLKDADEAYIAARFDGAVEILADRAEQNEQNRGDLGDHQHSDSDNSNTNHQDSEKARDKMVSGMTDAWKTKA